MDFQPEVDRSERPVFTYFHKCVCVCVFACGTGIKKKEYSMYNIFKNISYSLSIFNSNEETIAGCPGFTYCLFAFSHLHFYFLTSEEHSI